MPQRPEESPVYAFLRNPSMVDYPGRMAAVFFLSGCNFKCPFCHNRALMRQKQKGIPWTRLDPVLADFRENWVEGVVITGGEPTLDPALLPLIRRLRAGGWLIKLDTNGSNPDVLRQCIPLVGYVAMDVKAGLPAYESLTGWNDTAKIQESIDLIKSEAADYEFRTTIIDSIHTDPEMMQIGRLIEGSRRYVLQPFLPREDIPDPALAGTPRTSPDRLNTLAALMKNYAGAISVRGG
jgi:pyruvate formate lyase activating enzyme